MYDEFSIISSYFFHVKEHLNYGNNLDMMELEIKNCREEVKQLKIMYQDAVLAKDAALEELRRQEELVFTERRRRDIELQNMKQVAQEKQLLQEKVEKRIVNLFGYNNY